MPYLLTCAGCGATATIDGEQVNDPDRYLDCVPDGGCCLKDHHHGQQANACPQTHAGPCSVANPDCTVCRSIIIAPLPGSMVDQGVA
jgi:hypothetical protein